MTQDVTPHQRWVEWEQRRGKGSSLGARSGDGPTHKVKRPIFRGYVSFKEGTCFFETSRSHNNNSPEFCFSTTQQSQCHRFFFVGFLSYIKVKDQPHTLRIQDYSEISGGWDWIP